MKPPLSLLTLARLFFSFFFYLEDAGAGEGEEVGDPVVVCIARDRGEAPAVVYTKKKKKQEKKK
jgi:hypothetical protein